MAIPELFKVRKPVISFEFFPPKTDAGYRALFETIEELKPLSPGYVSITMGAGGSTREKTVDLTIEITQKLGLTTMAHLPCTGFRPHEIGAILETLYAGGVHDVLALRGDPPRDDPNFELPDNGFQYANQLVEFIRSRPNAPDARGFGIGVAGFPEGHPGTPNRLVEMDYLKRKVDAGADYICTQLFFENRDFYDFRERCELAGIAVPIVVGVMPIASKAGMVRMAELALGARIPARLLKAVNRCEDDDAVRRVGVHWATEQCRDLLDNNVRGIHFYTLNKSDATRRIYENLGIADSGALADYAV